jgi:ubiquinone biosynthesis protein COQ4
MNRFGELLRSLNNLRLLAAIGRSGGDLTSVADLIDCRYPPLQPDIDAMLKLPADSLGSRYGRLIRSLGYDPEFFRPRPIETESKWLSQRIATTHDIHHVVSGFGTGAEGELGVLAITAFQIGFPAYVVLTAAAQLASFRLQLERFENLSRALAHGAAISRSARCLAAVRWEEGWERPVSDWRGSWASRSRPTGSPTALSANRSM